MQKRKPCVSSHLHLPKTFPRPLHNQTLFIKSKSHHDIKRRRLQRKSSKQKIYDHDNNIRMKEDVFGCLESLFDLKKPLTLPEIPSPLLNYCPTEEKLDNLTFEFCINNSNLEPNIINQVKVLK